MIRENPDDYHVPIMANEVKSFLMPERCSIIAECCLGGGGHTAVLLKALKKGGHIYSIDKDTDAIEAATRRINLMDDIDKTAFKAIRGNFFDIKQLLSCEGISMVDAVFADLGVSSHQLNCAERGFSHRFDSKLDMRMDKTASLSAYDVVNGYTGQRLYEIIRDYGEEKFASRIANEIVKKREIKPIETTFELVDIIKSVMPMKVLREKGHPASRTFQALRIEVNGELDGLEQAIRDCVDILAPKGRIAIITFHSLEDRIVKNTLKSLYRPCTCDPKAPICTCGKKPVIELVTHKPVVPSEEELQINPRARSAKLRVAEKLSYDETI